MFNTQELRNRLSASPHEAVAGSVTPASCDSAARQAAAFNARGYRKIKMVAASSNARRSFVQTFMFWAFRLATYFVLACATYIFLDIAIKGSRIVFTNHAPFINVNRGHIQIIVPGAH